MLCTNVIIFSILVSVIIEAHFKMIACCHLFIFSIYSIYSLSILLRWKKCQSFCCVLSVARAWRCILSNRFLQENKNKEMMENAIFRRGQNVILSWKRFNWSYNNTESYMQLTIIEHHVQCWLILLCRLDINILFCR